MKRWYGVMWVLVGLQLAPSGCSESDSIGNLADGYGEEATDDTDGVRGSLDVGDEPISLAPPQVAGEYLLIPNPLRDSVSIVHSRSYEIETVEVGKNPTSVFALDGRNVFAVHNAGDATVSRVNADSGEVTPIALRPFMNAVAIDVETGYGIGYVDRSALDSESLSDEVLSLVEITLFSLDDADSTTLSIGEPVSAIRFGSGQSAAIVVTPSQVFRFDLATRAFVRIGMELPIVEILVLPDASRVFARLSDASLLVLDLPSGVTSTVVLPGEANDIELADDATAIYGIATTGGVSTLFRIDTDTLAVATQNLGKTYDNLALYSQTAQAVIYSTDASRTDALEVDYSTFGSLDTAKRTLIKPASRVFFNPTGSSYLVTHKECTCEVDSFYKSGTLISVADWESGILTPIRLQEEISDLDFAADGRFLFAKAGPENLLAVDLDRHLHSLLPTDSEAVYLGAIPTTETELGRVYASQEHPLGRLAFYTITSVEGDIAYEVQTLTGYELNGSLGEEQ